MTDEMMEFLANIDEDDIIDGALWVGERCVGTVHGWNVWDENILADFIDNL